MTKLQPRAEEATQLLSAMANQKRLLILCNLLDRERSVTELSSIVELEQSPLSQHLAKLRALGLVRTRRDGQSIYYRLASQEVSEVLETLYRIYCGPALEVETAQTSTTSAEPRSRQDPRSQGPRQQS